MARVTKKQKSRKSCVISRMTQITAAQPEAAYSQMAQQWNISSWLLPEAFPSSWPIHVPFALTGRVYIHSLPERFNKLNDGPITMKHGVYLKAERIFHELLMRSDAITPSIDSASLFFVPVYTGLLAMNTDSRRAGRVDEFSAALAALTADPSGVWPSRSREHLFALTVDRGRCFQVYRAAAARDRSASLALHHHTVACCAPDFLDCIGNALRCPASPHPSAVPSHHRHAYATHSAPLPTHQDESGDRLADATVLMHDGTTRYPSQHNKRLDYACHRLVRRAAATLGREGVFGLIGHAQALGPKRLPDLAYTRGCALIALHRHSAQLYSLPTLPS